MTRIRNAFLFAALALLFMIASSDAQVGPDVIYNQFDTPFVSGVALDFDPDFCGPTSNGVTRIQLAFVGTISSASNAELPNDWSVTLSTCDDVAIVIAEGATPFVGGHAISIKGCGWSIVFVECDDQSYPNTSGTCWSESGKQSVEGPGGSSCKPIATTRSTWSVVKRLWQ